MIKKQKKKSAEALFLVPVRVEDYRKPSMPNVTTFFTRIVP